MPAEAERKILKRQRCTLGVRALECADFLMNVFFKYTHSMHGKKLESYWLNISEDGD